MLYTITVYGSTLNYTTDVINAVAYSVYGSGPVTIDHDNTVKSFSLSPMMLGRGHTLLEPMGPVWVCILSNETFGA